jgi:very-short-patch-repair endonuclease
MRDRFTKQRARELRSKQTEAEQRLWYFLRRNNFDCHFKRQYPVGPYFADFACVRLKLVIEIDGGQHAAQIEYDAVRDRFIRDQGFDVLMFWSNEVLQQSDAVLAVIWSALEAKKRSPPP